MHAGFISAVPNCIQLNPYKSVRDINKWNNKGWTESQNNLSQEFVVICLIWRQTKRRYLSQELLLSESCLNSSIVECKSQQNGMGRFSSPFNRIL